MLANGISNRGAYDLFGTCLLGINASMSRINQNARSGHWQPDHASVIEPNLRFASPENGNNAENTQRISAQRAVELPNSGRGDSLPEATSPPTAGFPATL